MNDQLIGLIMGLIGIAILTIYALWASWTIIKLEFEIEKLKNKLMDFEMRKGQLK